LLQTSDAFVSLDEQLNKAFHEVNARLNSMDANYKYLYDSTSHEFNIVKERVTELENKMDLLWREKISNDVYKADEPRFSFDPEAFLYNTQSSNVNESLKKEAEALRLKVNERFLKLEKDLEKDKHEFLPALDVLIKSHSSLNETISYIQQVYNSQDDAIEVYNRTRHNDQKYASKIRIKQANAEADSSDGIEEGGSSAEQPKKTVTKRTKK